MKKNGFVFLVIVIMIFVGMNCFAQSAQGKLIQGEWLVIRADTGDEIMELTQPPYSGVVELLWIFQGNNIIQMVKDIRNNTSEVITNGTFIIAAESLIISYDNMTEAISFTFQNNNLILQSKDGTLTCRKR